MTVRRLILGLFIVYCAVMSAWGFVQYVHDDHVVVEHNPQVTWPPDLHAIFTGRWLGDQQKFGYVAISRPLATLSFCVENALGLGTPAARHAVQLGLNVGLCLLVFALGLRLLQAAGLARDRADTAAVAMAFLFAAHPTHIEVLASLAYRPEILALLFTLAATWQLLSVRTGQAGRWTSTGAVLAFGAALLCKESALGALLAWTVWALAARDRRFLRPLAAMVAVTLAWLAWRRATIGAFTSAGIPVVDNPLVAVDATTRWLNALAILWRALTHLVWPVGLLPDYTFDVWPVVHELNPEVVSGGLLLLAGIVGVVWLVVRPRPSGETLAPDVVGGRELGALGLAWFGAHWLPVSHLLFPSTVMFADRLLFAPSLAFAALFGAVALAWYDRLPSVPHWRVLALVLSLAAFSWSLLRWGADIKQYSALWRSDRSLYEEGAYRAPRSARMRYNRAYDLAQRGLESARWDLLAAARLTPRDPDVLVLGLELARGEHCDDAEPHLQVLDTAKGPAVKMREATTEWGLACKTFARAWPIARKVPPRKVDGDWPLRIYALGVAAADEPGARQWAQAFVADPAREPAWVSAAVFGDEQAGRLAQAAKRLQDLQRARPELQGLDQALAELKRRHPELAELPATVSETHGNP